MPLSKYSRMLLRLKSLPRRRVVWPLALSPIAEEVLSYPPRVLEKGDLLSSSRKRWVTVMNFTLN